MSDLQQYKERQMQIPEFREGHEKLHFETSEFFKLKEAEMESASNHERYPHANVIEGIRAKLAKAGDTL